MGKINLRCYFRHPLTRQLLIFVPVLPLALRMGPHGGPNCIGQKYERVLEAHARYAEGAPEITSAEYALAVVPDLDAAFADLVGTGDAITIRSDFAGGEAEPSSLIELLYRAILHMSEDVDVVARACCLAIEVSARL